MPRIFSHQKQSAGNGILKLSYYNYKFYFQFPLSTKGILNFLVWAQIFHFSASLLQNVNTQTDLWTKSLNCELIKWFVKIN